MYLRITVVYDLNRKFVNRVLEFVGKKYCLKIKSPSVNLSISKDLFCGSISECFASALWVTQLETAGYTKNFYIELGCDLSDKGISFIAVLTDVSWADKTICLRMSLHIFTKIFYNLCSVCKVCISEHNNVALSGQHCMTHRTAFAVILGSSDNADIVQSKRFNDFIRIIFAAVVWKNNLKIIFGVKI